MTQNFVVKKTLGSGSYGTVKLVVRKDDQKQYAMKEINVAKMDERDKKDQLNEIRILASVFHPNVIAYYEAFLEDGKLFIITELADSGDLDSEIQNKIKTKQQYTEPEIWSVLLQSLSGLRELHEMGILHRDIKGQNILRCSNPENPKKMIYKLADFGVSKVLKSEDDFTKTGIGTPYYICPEIWSKKQYNEKADIFSMGVLLYELMSLKHPYDGKDMNELNRNVLKGKYAQLPTKYSENLRKLCYEMMANDPDKRPTVKEIMIQKYVEEHYEDSPVSLEEIHLGLQTALEAKVEWQDQEMLNTIQMNPKLLAAMQGRQQIYQNPYAYRAYNPYSRPVQYQAPQKISNDDIKKMLPENEYNKRKNFEIMQKVHQDRKDRDSQASTQSTEDDGPIMPSSLQQNQPVKQNPFSRDVTEIQKAQDKMKQQAEQDAKYLANQKQDLPPKVPRPNQVYSAIKQPPQQKIIQQMVQQQLNKPSSAQQHDRKPVQQQVPAKPPSVPQRNVIEPKPYEYKPPLVRAPPPKVNAAKEEYLRQQKGNRFW